MVGNETGDDAAVWRRPDGRALVSTADFFTPIVDDARLWGRIAAVNAANDVYAMGGTPLFALALAAWPVDVLPLDLLGEVLAGGLDAAAEGGWVVAGGHTVDGPEPMYGQAVTGEVDVDEMFTNAGLAAGQTLVLTKPIGTGLITTALKRSPAADARPGGPLAAAYEAAVTEMTRLDAEAAVVARAARATGATDVTGFGLVGHLHRMARASGVAIEIDPGTVPLLPGAEDLARAGQVPGGTGRNRAFLGDALVDVRGTERGAVPDVLADILADPQTAGGLLFGCDPAAVTEALAALTEKGHTAAAVGTVIAPVDGAPTGTILIV